MVTHHPRFRLAALLIMLGSVAPAVARPVPFRNYDRAVKEADVVVIASPVATRETKERQALPGIAPPLPAIGMEATLEVAALLKGELPGAAVVNGKKRLVLHYFRLEKPETVMVNGPGLVHFDVDLRGQYLMFLKREADGRYEALTGQSDPDLSIEPLRFPRYFGEGDKPAAPQDPPQPSGR